MKREEKVKEGERKREGELMVEKLMRGIWVGKREGKSTPSPTWKFGILQPDGTLIQDSNFFTNSNTLSARKLGANLWEMEPHLNHIHRVANINKNGPIANDHRFAISKDLEEAAATSPSKEEETSGMSFRKQLAASLAQHNARIDKAEQAQQPLSPASCSSSMEMAPRNSSLVSNGKFGESSYSLKSSTELLKVLNRIWSLEEKHVLDMSLVRTLKRELEQSQAQIQELRQEKKRDQNEIDHLTKQMTEYKVARKREQKRIKDAVKLVEDKLEHELESRKHSEKRHHKLAKELSQMKCSFSNVLRELDRERKARILLEDLCDEFAKGIRDYEQEVRLTKHKFCKDQIGKVEGNDRLILHISEAWLDERAQMKLADASDISEQHSALDKLCLEIEAFLREKQSDHSGKNADTSSSKSPSQSRAAPHSLESLHLNEPASAPWRGNDEEDDSIGTTNLRPCLSRGYSFKQVEAASDGRNRETMRLKPGNEKVHSRRGADLSSSHIQADEQLHHHHHQQVNEGSTKSRNVNSNEASHPRMPRKGEILQRSCREGKTGTTDDVDMHDARTASRLGQDNHRVEGFFDPSSFVGPTSPAKKWTSEVSSMDPDVSEYPTICPNSVKPNTLKAKLIEARLEGQQSRTRNPRGLPKVD